MWILNKQRASAGAVEITFQALSEPIEMRASLLDNGWRGREDICPVFIF